MNHCWSEDDLNPENVAEDAFFVSDRARPVSSMKAQPRVVARGNGGPAFRIAEVSLFYNTGFDSVFLCSQPFTGHGTCIRVDDAHLLALADCLSCWLVYFQTLNV